MIRTNVLVHVKCNPFYQVPHVYIHLGNASTGYPCNHYGLVTKYTWQNDDNIVFIVLAASSNCFIVFGKSIGITRITCLNEYMNGISIVLQVLKK